MAVSADSSAIGHGTVTDTNTVTFSQSVTDTDSNVVIVVAVMVATPGGTGSTVTYNTQSLTSAGRQVATPEAPYVQLFYRALGAATPGAHNVVVTNSGTADSIIGVAQVFKGVDQSTVVQNFTSNPGSGTHPTVTVTSADGNAVFGAVVARETTTGMHTGEGSLDYREDKPGGGDGSGITGFKLSTSGSTVIGMDISTAAYAVAGVDLIAAPTSVNANPVTATVTADATNAVGTIPVLPGAPTDLTATPGDSQMGLTWTAPADDGGTALTDYFVEYRVTP